MSKPEPIVLDNTKTVREYIKNRYENPPTAIHFKSAPVLSSYLGGVGEEEAVLLVSSTGASKTKTALRLYVLDVVDYIMKNPEFDVEIVFISLELSAIEIYLNIFSALLHEKTKKEYSPRYLQNRDGSKKLDEQTLKDIELIKDELDFLDTKLRVVDNLYAPSEIYQYIKREVLLKSGIFVNTKYIKKNAKKNTVIILDTINALNPDKGKTEYESIKYWSEFYTKKILKKVYKATVVNIQQTDKASTTAQYSSRGSVVEDKFTPKLENLAKCKTTPDDHTLVLSIYNPYNYEVPEYHGYNVAVLKNYFRYIKILKSSHVEAGKGKAIFIDNANLQVFELPKANKGGELREIYEKYNLVEEHTETRLAEYEPE